MKMHLLLFYIRVHNYERLYRACLILRVFALSRRVLARLRRAKHIRRAPQARASERDGNQTYLKKVHDRTGFSQEEKSAMAEKQEEHAKVGVSVLVMNGDRVLLEKRQHTHGAGTWGPPSGHIDFGETPEQTAERETREETGGSFKRRCLNC
jgi:hypothetical protein